MFWPSVLKEPRRGVFSGSGVLASVLQAASFYRLFHRHARVVGTVIIVVNQELQSWPSQRYLVAQLGPREFI